MAAIPLLSGVFLSPLQCNLARSGSKLSDSTATSATDLAASVIVSLILHYHINICTDFTQSNDNVASASKRDTSTPTLAYAHTMIIAADLDTAVIVCVILHSHI